MTAPPEGADPFELERFVRAQNGDYARALAELQRGAKRSHWMWYIFPQMRGLGASQMSRRYGLGSRAEAEAYLRHPVLGPRLRTCAAALLAVTGRTAREILGSPDDLKLRSSATLFAEVSGERVFRDLLERFFGGKPDPETLRLLAPGDEAG